MGKIGVNIGKVNSNLNSTKSTGMRLLNTSDGLRDPDSTYNTSTPKVIREKYSKLTSLVKAYGKLVINDAQRIQKIAEHMKEYDEKVGSRR